MIRQTSIGTYTAIREQGLLSRMRFMVYDVVYKCGPITQGECAKYHLPQLQKQCVTPRFAELERQGVIVSVGERPCKTTGRVQMVWQTTDNLPIKLVAVKKIVCPTCEGTGHITDKQMGII